MTPPASECPCLDWTAVGYPAHAYYPLDENGDPTGHHPSCEHYVAPDPLEASRYPKLPDEWLPVVAWACIAPEIAGITYGPNYLQLHYQLGAARSSLMIAIEQVRRAVKPSDWQERIHLALLQLRLARSSFVVRPRSAEEWDDIVRRRRAEGLVE